MIRRLPCFLSLILCLAPPAFAGEDDHDKPGKSYGFGNAEITLNLDAAFGLFSSSNAQNGQGSLSAGGRAKGSRDWAEGFVAPGLTIDYFVNDTTFYGGVSLLGSASRGSGEPQRNSVTGTRPEKLELDQAYLGWKSGLAFSELGEDAVDLSVGRQGFVIGDGFLIADGTLDSFRRGAYVIGPRASFDNTAIARLNTAPVRADLFHLEGNVDQHSLRGKDNAGTSLYGGNIEWFGSSHKDHGRTEYDERQWYLGATALKLYDADRALAASRDGMTVWSVRSGGAVLAPLSATLKDVALYSEYAREDNTNLNAKAWYVEPQYTFSALPWSPRVSYRYMHFSGDSDTNDSRNTAWDPLYTAGGPRGYGSWDLGEIYERYIGSNSNLNSQMVQLKLQPLEDLSAGVIYYRHNFDKRESGVTSDRLMDEVNVFAVWETPVKGLTLSTVLGAAKAGDGRRQQQNTTDPTDRTMWLGQMIAAFQF